MPQPPARDVHSTASRTSKSEVRFDAFISYRREGVDREWAEWLQTALETYRPPAALHRERPDAARRLRVFRDDTETSASASLSATIEEALEASRHLIVVASPRSAASRWVDREVRWFLDHGRRDRILVLLIDGDPTTAFPPSLRGADEPLAADVRPPAPPSVRARRRTARLRLLAPLLGVEFDALVRRDSVRRRRSLALLGTVAALALGGAGVLAYGLWSAKEESQATKGQLAGTARRLDETRAEKDAADRAAAAAEVAARAAKAATATKEAERVAAAEKEKEAQEAAERAKAAAEAEATARRAAEVGLALDRARAYVEAGKPREALREAWAALRADPASVGARMLVGRLLRARSALLAEAALGLTNVDAAMRATSASDAWLVRATGANFQPGVQLVGADGAPIGPAVAGAFARLDAPNVDRSGRTRLAFQPPFAGTAALELWTSGDSNPRWRLAKDAASLGWSALSPDAKRIAFTRLGETSVHLVDAETGAELVPLKGTASGGAFVSPDRIALGRFPAGIDVLDLATRKVVATIDTGKDRVGSVLATGDGALVFESHPNGPLLVDVAHARVVARWQRSTTPPHVAFGAAGTPFVVEWSEGDSVRVWDVGSGRLLREIPRGEGGDSIVSAGVRPGHRELATHHLDTSARLWNIDSSAVPTVFGPIVPPALGAPAGRPTPTPFDAQGARMVTLAEQGRLAVFDVDARRMLTTLRVSTDAVGAGLSRAGDEVHVVTSGGRFERWSVAAAAAPGDWSLELPGSTCVACASPDGALVARGSFEGRLTLLRARDGTVLGTPEWKDEWITSLAFAPKGDVVAVASRYRQPVRLVDVKTGNVLRTLDVRRRDPPALLDTSATDYVWVATLVDDEVLSYGSNGATVWSVTSGRAIASLAPANGEQADAIVGEDGATVLVSTHDGSSVWRREDRTWRNVRGLGGAAGAGRWLGVRASSGVAYRFVPPAHVEVVPWRDGAAARSFDLEGAPFRRVELLTTGEVAFVGADGTLRVVDLTDGRERYVVRPPATPRDPAPFGGVAPERDEPTDRHVAVGPPASWLAAVDPQGGFWVADAVRRSLVGRWTSDDPTIGVLATDAGGTLVRIGDRRIDGLRVEPEVRSVEALAPIVEARLR